MENIIIKNVVIADDIKKIYEHQFWKKDTETLDLGKSVKTICKGAFNDNKIKDLIIPDSVEKIGEDVFAYNK